VVRRQGKGTYVVAPLQHDLGASRDFFDTLFAQGQRPDARLLVCSAASPPPEVAQMLGLAIGQPALGFERLYVIEDRPIGIASGWLTPEALSVPRALLEANSTGAILREVLGLSIARADLRIRSARAGRSVARALGISANAPVLTHIRDRYLADGRAVEIASMTMRAEAFEFYLTTQGPDSTSVGLQSICGEQARQ
jgi:GntR family transcriptional regulator